MKWQHVALCAVVLVTTVAAQWSASLSLPISAASIALPGGASASGLRLWVDSSEAATLGLDPRVRFWFDKSGDGRHLTVSAGTRAPYATAISSRQQVIFDDGALALGQPITLSTITAFFVIRGGSDTGYHPLLGRSDHVTGFVIDARRLRALSNGTSVITGVFGSITGASIVTIRTNGAGTDYASVNGGTEYLFSFNTSESVDRVGAIHSAAGARLLQASISEIIIWNRAMNVTERTGVLRALGAKWGVTVP
jgi:hypothetical protein